MTQPAFGSSLMSFNFTDFITLTTITSGTKWVGLSTGTGGGFRSHITFPDGSLAIDIRELITLPAIMPQEYSGRSFPDGTIWHSINYAFDEEVDHTKKAKLGISWAVLSGERSDLDGVPSWQTEQTILLGASNSPSKALDRERQISRPGCDNISPGNLFQIRLRRLVDDVEDTATGRLRIFTLNIYERP